MLKLMICPLSSSFCSFRFLLSCSQQTNQMLLKHVVPSEQIRGEGRVFRPDQQLTHTALGTGHGLLAQPRQSLENL